MFFAIAPRYELKKRSALLIDMGGGSVEVTVAWDRRAVGAESLRLGPVRLLQMLKEQDWPEFRTPHLLERHGFAIESFVETELKPGMRPEMAFGAGGNIEELAELRAPLLGKRKTHKIKIGDLESMIPILIGTPIKDRMSELKLRPDRADVIAVAAMVLHMIMDEAGIQRLFVPRLGIKDGILSQLAAAVPR
jgi:exopolyphosphatase/guanosine-5'-triphosphate,3'-diphosphate pyrophosphatase